MFESCTLEYGFFNELISYVNEASFVSSDMVIDKLYSSSYETVALGVDVASNEYVWDVGNGT